MNSEELARWSVSVASVRVIPFYILDRILLHGRPVVSLSKYFICQGSVSKVATTDSFVHLSHCVVRLRWKQAFQERKRVGSLIEFIVKQNIMRGLTFYLEGDKIVDKKGPDSKVMDDRIHPALSLVLQCYRPQVSLGVRYRPGPPFAK